MFYDGNKSYFPLICIGQNVPTGDGGTIPCLCVSPSGRIAIVESDPAARGESAQQFLDRMTACSAALRHWNYPKLDSIAAQFFYSRDGQAARVIDRMVRCGYLTFSDNLVFSFNLNKGLQEAKHLIIVSTAKADLAERKAEFKQGAYQDSDLLFAVMDSAAASIFIEP